MSVTTRNVTGGVSVGYTMTAKGSVSGAKTTVYFVFDAEGAIFGAESTSDFSVYVDGTKKSLSWTVNKTENWMGRPIVIKATRTRASKRFMMVTSFLFFREMRDYFPRPPVFFFLCGGKR